MDKQELLERIQEHKAIIGIVGLGYVGLPLALTFLTKKFTVIGVDNDNRKIEKLRKAESYMRHVDASKLDEHIKAKRFTASNDYAHLTSCDVIIICVPTPLTANREPNLDYVQRVTSYISMEGKKGRLIVLESTTYPGTTDTVVRKILEMYDAKLGQDFYLAFSPEREDPGNRRFNTKNIPKIVGGVTQDCSEVATALYKEALDKVVTVANSRVAEMSKLLENTFRGVNIALVNELKILCDAMDIDIWEVIDAAATKPFGFMPFYPGPGLGGHCIPVDPFYLAWKAREHDLTAKFIELAGEINTSMHHYVLDKVVNALNAKKKAVNGSKVLVMGLAYKADIDDVRESPALALVDMLLDHGADVSFHDSYVPEWPYPKPFGVDLNTKSVPATPETYRAHDVAVIVTKHSDVNYKELVQNSSLVVDCRNATKKLDHKNCLIFKA